MSDLLGYLLVASDPLPSTLFVAPPKLLLEPTRAAVQS